MTEAEVAARCIDKVITYLKTGFAIKDWEAQPIAADVVLLVLNELKVAKERND